MIKELIRKDNGNVNVDIVSLIENNPLIRLSGNYQSRLINKIKEKFNTLEQHLFVSSFYCYLNYNNRDDFIINLDDIWKWIGFSRKGDAKKLLEKNFKIDSEYKILLLQSPKLLGNISGSGLNKETILLYKIGRNYHGNFKRGNWRTSRSIKRPRIEKFRG